MLNVATPYHYRAHPGRDLNEKNINVDNPLAR